MVCPSDLKPQDAAARRGARPRAVSHLAGDGVFAAWEDPSFFSAVRFGPSGSVVWGDCPDLYGDALCLKSACKSVTGCR